MRVLVVGVSGFLGRHIASALLEAGNEVMGTSRRGGDGNVVHSLGEPLPSEIEAFAPEVAVDLAWEGIPDFSLERCRANVDGQKALFDALARLGSLRRLVVAGTCREYGDAVGLATGIPCPVDDFGRAKNEVHQLAIECCKKSGISLTWFRIFYVYGQGQRSGSLLPSLMADLALEREPLLENPSSAHDFVEVSDVASAFVCSLESSGYHDVLDLGSGSLVDVGTVSDLVTQIAAGKELLNQPARDDAASDQRSVRANLDQTLSAIGWRPVIPLEVGIRRMVEEAQLGDGRLGFTTGDQYGTET